MRWEEAVSGPGLGEDGSWVGCPVGLPSDRMVVGYVISPCD